MTRNIDQIKDLSCWIIERVARNQTQAIDPDAGCDWDWVAAEVWNYYPGIVDEFYINDAIDFIIEAAEYSKDH
jgi:hypothetical protein